MTARMDGNGTDREGRRADDDRGQGQMFRRGPEKWRRTGRPAGVNLTPRIVVWTGPRFRGGRRTVEMKMRAATEGRVPRSIEPGSVGANGWMVVTDPTND